jgi:membrane associated rhomboid family serine protease
MNVLLIAANIVMYVASQPFFHGLGGMLGTAGGGPGIPGISPRTGLLTGFDRFLLDPAHPMLYQFITYQFLHQNLSHIGFNMLFLYVFGNNLNEKLGHVGYLAFYLTGGVLAGCGHLLMSTNPTLGASGAISAVTGLFLVLLPSTHIRMFVSIFFLYIDVWEIPSMFFILFKIGEDLFEQLMRTSNVAYMAHRSGTLAGIVIGLLLLFAGLVQRDHYDLLAIWTRYRRRKNSEALVASGYDPFGRTMPAKAQGGGRGGLLQELAGRVTGAAHSEAAPAPLDPRVESLRAEISRLLRLHELPDAVARYLELRTVDPSQVMAAQDQLDIANQLMADGRYAEAAGAYEDYLKSYPAAAQYEQIMLILGLIYARYYPRAERAKELFTAALPRLHDAAQRELAETELRKLGSSPPPPPPPPGPPPSGPGQSGPEITPI